MAISEACTKIAKVKIKTKAYIINLFDSLAYLAKFRRNQLEIQSKTLKMIEAQMNYYIFKKTHYEEICRNRIS